jgi:GTP-binding protein
MVRLRAVKLPPLYTFSGLKRKDEMEVSAENWVSIVGLDDINIGETICDPEHPEALPMIKVDEPTLSMKFMVNNSPFAVEKEET